jgi:dipeptidyl aminopeptidase/acylaminoacyl peptidase
MNGVSGSRHPARAACGSMCALIVSLLTATAAASSDYDARLVLVRSNAGDSLGRLGVVDPAQPGEIRLVGSLVCEVAYAAGGRGICLNPERRILGEFSATLFDVKTFTPLGKIPIRGLPSRARVSPDGRLAAYTVFTSGHGYASVDFSTDTQLIDVAKVQVLANLEEFAVTRDGKPFKSRDFNFWGVTFTPDSKFFYATLSTQGQHLLVKGDIATRTAVVIHDKVECPSLSPDGRRIAYKKRSSKGNTVTWTLSVLDLASGRETPLPEQRSVDDQLEWLDNDRLLYVLPNRETGTALVMDLWMIPADGGGEARLYLKAATSPSAMR